MAALIEIIFYVLLGLFVGTASGLLGIGGGIILIPAFLAIFHWISVSDTIAMHLAVGTSLATMMFVSLASTRAHHKQQAVVWPTLKILIPGILVGAPLGAAVASVLKSQWLEILFGFFMIGAAIQMILQKVYPKKKHCKLVPKRITSFAGTLIGFVAALFGLGGGIFTVPFLIRRNFSPASAVGTSVATAFPISVAGSIGYLVMGWHEQGLPPYSAGYVLLPAAISTACAGIFGTRVGAHLAHQLLPDALQIFFAMMLVLVGIKMIV